MMMTNKRIQQWILGSIVGGAIGLALACNDDQDNARDCWNADGDATCAELFGGERPFCTTDAQPCGAQAELGCVAQRPELDECYSPCGRGQSLLDNPACGTADSGDTDTTGTPDDFDEGGAGCGNGEVDDGEECDDGNEVADDSCTNACMSPRCGDGIVQLGVGEVCDDGGIEPGDGCTISCQLRGAMVGDVNSELMEVGRAVVVDSQDHVTVSGTALGLSWLAKFDAGLEPQWDRDALGSGLALGPADQLLIGGSLLAQAQSQQIQADGTELWSDGLANKPSSFSAVAMVEGHAVSVGYRNLMNKVGLLVRHDVSTGAILSTADWQDGPLGPVAVDQSGWVWAIGDGANPELHIYDESDNLVHMMPLEPGIYEDLALDQQGSVHLLARAEDHSSFTVTKLTEAVEAWPAQTYEGASARGLALLPGGTIVVAGHTSDESSGLLVWYDQLGGEIVHELEIDGEAAFEVFHDVAVAPDGAFAVAVGGSGAAADNTTLWLYTFEI